MGAVDVLLEKLSKQDGLAFIAGNALLDQVRKNPSKLADKIAILEPYLSSANHDIRAITACVLGKVGTDEALGAVLESFELTEPNTLEVECRGISGFGTEPLYRWILGGISDGQNERAAELLAYIVAGKEFKQIFRTGAMVQLYNCMSHVGGYRLPADCLAAIHEFADHKDPNIAENAIQLLGAVSDEENAVESSPNLRPPSMSSFKEKTVEQRPIDFRTVNMSSLLNEMSKTKFAAVRPRDFEDMIGRYFKDSGFIVDQTPYSCDFGADLIVDKAGLKTAVQVKRYAPVNKVGVKDVNQVIGAQKYYACKGAMVITTSGFTKSATEVARRASVELWNWDKLSQTLNSRYIH